VVSARRRLRASRQPADAVIPGPDPAAPKPILEGVSRMYRGLSVSAIRSITTHGLLWTFFDYASSIVDSLTIDPVP
jgi:solute carrier family 25 carnitine/acylcarnitine transporter 20/29